MDVHLKKEWASMPVQGTLPSSRRLKLALGLPLKNTAALQQVLKKLYDPQSPQYRHFLSPGEFTEKFGPAESEYKAVQDFAQANGLRVVKTYPSRMLVDVEGTVGDVGRAFHVNFVTHFRPDGTLFYAPDREPTAGPGIPILHASGLDNFNRPRHNLVIYPPNIAAKRAADPGKSLGTGPLGNYQGMDFRNAYASDVPAALNGAGQTVGLFEINGFSLSDVLLYESTSTPSFSAPVPVTVLLHGFNGIPTDQGDQNEVTLDIDMVISMAPGAQVKVYEAPDTPGTFDAYSNDILAAMAAPPSARRSVVPGAGSGIPQP